MTWPPYYREIEIDLSAYDRPTCETCLADLDRERVRRYHQRFCSGRCARSARRRAYLALPRRVPTDEEVAATTAECWAALENLREHLAGAE